jgi:hypothetical protein
VSDTEFGPLPNAIDTAVARNASPIGEGWQLTLSHKGANGTLTSTLEDVYLSLTVAVRALS